MLKYQIVKYKGRNYTLTRLGFGLNVALKIFVSILRHVLALDPLVECSTRFYMNDILVTNARVSNVHVSILARYGLECKHAVPLAEAVVLGLRISQDRDKLI
ncbi:hypothetical protein GJ496_007164 [Pomphorhynchus laevis]|nr:hypothetical protein GJ496_007164 [Pomphorhynchus laevis]